MAKAPPKYPHIQNPSTRIYWDDLHAEPGLKIVSLAARGLWTYHMLAIMAASGGFLAVEGTPLTVEALAAIVGKPLEEVRAAYSELSTWKVFSVDRFGTPYNRRMAKMQKKDISNRKNGQNGGRPKLLKDNDVSDLETQTEPNANPNHNPKRGPRARGSQDSLKTQDMNISLREEKNPAQDRANGSSLNGHGTVEPGRLNGGKITARILGLAQRADTPENRRWANLLSLALPGDLGLELTRYETPATRIAELIREGEKIMILEARKN